MAYADPENRNPAADAETASLSDLAHDGKDYVRCWSYLLASETRLAQSSLTRLGFAVLLLPALALTVFVSTDTLVACLLNRWLQDWSSSIAITMVVDLCCLFGLILAMRRWLRNLGLPRSRRALTQLMERLA